MTKAQAIQSFLSNIITAYPEGAVPDNAAYPYLTYSLPQDSFGSEVNMTVNLWYYTDGETAINAKAQQIADAIGYGGTMVSYTGGAVWVKKGSPFCQSVTDKNNKIKRRYFNIDLEYMSQN